MLRVRELLHTDIPFIVRYWTESSPEHLQAMGVDLAKVPPAEALAANLRRQLETPLEEKVAYCLIGELDGIPAGHCNTNPTQFGGDAYMHLHLWTPAHRGQGLGTQMVTGALPYFFGKLQLQRLWSQPYALNAAPNKTLEKAGFLFDKEYVTVPGSLNFEQPVKQWLMTRERFNTRYATSPDRS
ncbi:MAG: N-acetyltransferase [Chitinophagaceae bacterium]|nr:MAG: N-acetyltransferase [Chitinophagaceae bacterium]